MEWFHGPYEIIQDVVTCWNSTWMMTKRFVEIRTAIEMVILEKQIETELSKSDWNTLEGIAALYSPFAELTTSVGSQKYPTLSALYASMRVIIRILSLFDVDRFPLLKKSFEYLRKETALTYASPPDVVLIALALDPKYKSLSLFQSLGTTATNDVNEF